MFIKYVTRMLNVYLFLLLCIFLNVGGHSVVYIQERMLFVDTIGTALASIAYGPLHGALVGLLSNNISFLFFEDNNTYLLYSMVHLALSATWGLVPRLFKRQIFDFFSPDCSYKNLLKGIASMAFIGAFAAAVAASIIKQGVPYDTTCTGDFYPSHYFELECIYRSYIVIFIGDTPATTFLISLIINMPDKLVSFAAAVIIISSAIPTRRLKLYDYRGGILSTNRRTITLFVSGTFVVAIFYNFYNIIHFVSDDTYQNILLNQSLVIALVFLISGTVIVFKGSGQNIFSTRPSDLKSNLHVRRNPASELVFEDGCRIAILYYFIMYLIISFAHKNDENLLSENLTSAISVSVFITLIKYVLLLSSRILQRNGHKSLAER